MSKQIEVFPFRASDFMAKQMFRSWMQENRAMLDRDYGRRGYVGEATAVRLAAEGFAINEGCGSIRQFSWYDVDVTIKSETEVTFTTYGMADAFRGGRSDEPQNVFEVKLGKKALAKQIHNRKMELAESEYYRRLEEEEERRRQAAIQNVYNELFPEAA